MDQGKGKVGKWAEAKWWAKKSRCMENLQVFS
jgi:hypothetical protein